MSPEIRLLAINASPVPNGQTDGLLRIFVENARGLNMSVKKIDLCSLDISHASGRLDSQTDGLSEWQRMIVSLDGFVIATPIYWFNVPGKLKDFIDNLTPLEEKGMLRDKVAAMIVYAPQGGGAETLSNLALVFNHMDMVVPPNGLIFYRGEQDQNYLRDITTLAARVRRQIIAQRFVGDEFPLV